MFNSVFKVSAGYFLAACIFGEAAGDGVGRGAPVDTLAGRLTQPDRDERERAMLELNQQYTATREAIVLALKEGSTNHLADTAVSSPLHCAIAAASVCRVYEAEALLFSVIGYELDRSTFPVGGLPLASSFFPAASALVELRVDSSKVVNAMCARPGTDMEIQLLTWVLATRAGSLSEAKRIMKDADQHPNVDRALACLNGAEAIVELLFLPDE